MEFLPFEALFYGRSMRVEMSTGIWRRRLDQNILCVVRSESVTWTNVESHRKIRYCTRIWHQGEETTERNRLTGPVQVQPKKLCEGLITERDNIEL